MTNEWYSNADRFVLMERVGQLLAQYRSGALDGSEMPEDAAPEIADVEQRVLFFTLPMVTGTRFLIHSLSE
jgi:hypothetical protein